MFRLLLTLAIMATIAIAGDVTGKWKSSMTTPNGQTVENVMKLKAEGDKLTGTISGRQGEQEIQEGKVSGDDVSFVVVRNFNGNEVKISYKGKLEGDTLKLNVSAGQRTFDITAKRLTE
jgi:hypothetical protein